jgi:hypothetical protein
VKQEREELRKRLDSVKPAVDEDRLSPELLVEEDEHDAFTEVPSLQSHNLDLDGMPLAGFRSSWKPNPQVDAKILNKHRGASNVSKQHRQGLMQLGPRSRLKLPHL